MSAGSGAEAMFAAVLAAAPTRPLITFYDDASGERIELSARSLANWVTKTHFLLLDELGLGVGDTALIALGADWITVPILLGCWSAGLTLTSNADDDAQVAFATPATLAAVGAGGSAPDVLVVNPASMTRSFAAAPVPGSGTDYVSAVRPQPDTWASVRFPAGPSDPAGIGMTRAQLTAAASERAVTLGFAPDARVLAEAPWTGVADWIDALLAPLAVGGSVVLVANPDPDPARRERRIEQEQITAAV
jgi:uncharacterized protein (TIGR03089 family)